jgi:sensor histidine kinase YesM
MNRTVIFWSLQVFGWLSYVIITYILNQISGNSSRGLLETLSFVFVNGIVVSSIFRIWIQRNNWASLNLIQLVPRALASSILIGILFHTMLIGFLYLLNVSRFNLTVQGNIVPLMGWITIFIIWSLIYFAFHFFENYRKEEIKNLKLLVLQNETEITKIKSQLNPHFLFNSMNSIKALVTENPTKAKASIIKLSNILRSTLQLGERKEIELLEELKIVNDYIDLEYNRYEERLTFQEDIDPKTLNEKVPPMIVQTLVENAIKHGIAHLPNGGKIQLTTKYNSGVLVIRVSNTGTLNQISSGTGLGIEQTKQRLNLLYGKGSTFQILQQNNMVVAELIIDKNGNKNDNNR